MKFIEQFRRNTTSSSFIPEIDGLRFFAIITVVIYHLNTALTRHTQLDWQTELGTHSFLEGGWWILRLDLGVKVFFSLSGFILALPFMKAYLNGTTPPPLKDYFIRRLLRLEPPFLLILFLFFVGQVVLNLDDVGNLTRHLLASIAYLHGFVFGYPSPINPVTWSLETEAQFYVVVPFIFLFFSLFKKRRIPLIFLLSLFVLSLWGKKFLYDMSWDHLRYSILQYGSHFLTGILFCYLYLRKSHIFQHKNIWFDFFGLISIFGMFVFYKPQVHISNCLMFNLSVFVFFISSFKGILLQRFFAHPIIYSIGGMCYSIYLIHYGFLHILIPHLPSHIFGGTYLVQLFWVFVLCIPLLLFVCAVFYLWIEKPCMNKNWPSVLIQNLKSIRRQ